MQSFAYIQITIAQMWVYKKSYPIQTFMIKTLNFIITICSYKYKI